MRKTKKKKTTSGRKQSFLREEVAFLYALTTEEMMHKAGKGYKQAVI